MSGVGVGQRSTAQVGMCAIVHVLAEILYMNEYLRDHEAWQVVGGK